MSATFDERGITYAVDDGDLVVDKLDELRADAIIADITAEAVSYVAAAPLPPLPLPTPRP